MNLRTFAAENEFSKALLTDVLAIERGDNHAWDHFAGFLETEPKLDGEYAETYSVACAEIFLRDPTFFLRRYLAGDKRALICSELGFEWSSPGFRKILLEVHRSRLKLETQEPETKRLSIEEFLDALVRVAAPLKKR